MAILKPFLAAVLTIIVLDTIWLGFVATPFYLHSLSEVANIVDGRIQPVFWAAGVVYLFLGIGIMAFVLPNVLRVDQGGSVLMIFAKGALLGLVIYGVYDFTNLATLKQYPVLLAVADTTWGAFVCGAATVAASLVQSKR